MSLNIKYNNVKYIYIFNIDYFEFNIIIEFIELLMNSRLKYPIDWPTTIIITLLISNI